MRDVRKWKTSFWNTYSPEAGMSKAEADESFVYADADGNEEVSEKEWLTLIHSMVRVLAEICKP